MDEAEQKKARASVQSYYSEQFGPEFSDQNEGSLAPIEQMLAGLDSDSIAL
jgi:hypothetical protein